MAMPSEDALVAMLAQMGITSDEAEEIFRNPAAATQFFEQALKPRIPDNNFDPKAAAEEAKQIRAKFEDERRKKPEKPLLIPRQMVLMSNQAERENKVAMRSGNAMHMVYKTFIGEPKSHSTTPLQALKPILLRDMFARKVHIGRFLLCRTIGLPVRKVCVEVPVEDISGQAMLLCLYNMPGLFQASPLCADAYLPRGTMLIIKEPWMKFSAHAANAFIRVDSPSDVVFLEPSSSMLSRISWSTPALSPQVLNAEAFKALGNKHFKDGFYIPAAHAWTRGLDLNPEFHVLRLNLAQAYLKLGWHQAALAEAKKFLLIPSLDSAMSEKAAYRAALAEYGLGLFDLALQRFQNLPNNIAIEHRGKCQARLKEQATGHYDWLGMYKAGQEPVPILDVAEFRGPIKVVPIPGRGRGIRASRAIRTGEIIMVAKPYTSVFTPELVPNEMHIGLNLITNRGDKGSQLGLVSRVAARIHGCPETHPMIDALYAGPTFPNPPPDVPLVPSSIRLERPLKHEVNIDIARIEGVATYNSFAPTPTGPIQGTSSGKSDTTDTPSALYVLPSLFNHSCSSNATWRCFGDAMAIRARQDISLDDEITVPYTGSVLESERASHLKKYIPSKCDCSLCVLDRADGQAASAQLKRSADSRRQEKKTLLSAGRSIIPKTARVIDEQIEQINKTFRPDRGPLRPAVFSAYYEAMQFWEKQASLQGNPKLYDKVVVYCVKAFEAAGMLVLSRNEMRRTPRSLTVRKTCLPTAMVDVDTCIMMCIHAATGLDILGKEAEAKAWYRTSWWMHEMTFGGGKELYNVRVGGALAGMPLLPWLVSMKYEWD